MIAKFPVQGDEHGTCSQCYSDMQGIPGPERQFMSVDEPRRHQEVVPCHRDSLQRLKRQQTVSL